MRATARLTYQKIRFDRPQDLHLVVELRAPSLDWQRRRPPVCVLPVIDVSGSMQGAKLRYAKQSVMKLVDHLAPGDFCGLVTFTGEVATRAAPAEMTQPRKDALRAVVGQLEPQGSTNFAGGLLAGLEHLNRLKLPPGMTKRAIMFTDGLANVGVATKGPDLLRLLAAHQGDATVSAFGYGEDADQELLRDLANRGGGNYAFVQSPEEALTAFARELGGLLSTYARDAVVEVRPAAGVALTEVVSDVDATEEQGVVRIRIPDHLAEEVRHLVLAARVDAAAAPGRAPVALLAGRYGAVDADTARLREERFEVAVEVERVVAGEEQREPSPEVDEVVALAQLVRAQIEAEAQARRGEFAQAQRLMHELLRSLRTRGRDAAANACERVMATVADRAAYEDRDSAAFRTSLRAGVTRGSRGSKHAEAEVVLHQAGVQLTTRAQEAVARDFHAGPPAGAKAPHKVPRSGGLDRKRSRRW
jgi:Ca-activated chloride channel family protein